MERVRPTRGEPDASRRRGTEVDSRAEASYRGAISVHASGLESRLELLSEAHQRAIRRFVSSLAGFIQRGMLNAEQASIIEQHLVRLGERQFNPANTGNLEDLFAYTLEDTKDAVRAFAQVLADSVKVVPIDADARLLPRLKSLVDGRIFARVGDLAGYGEPEKMLISHTMVAYGDMEMAAFARALIRASHAEVSELDVERRFARMAVQSQHAPSSSFVLARMRGLTIDLLELYRTAGYDDDVIANAQSFYDTCAEFRPEWVAAFLDGRIPEDDAWLGWRARYLDRRRSLPEELVYQLHSDTLTNFLDGTLESGKWVDASILFGGVKAVEEIPAALARIVNQYVAEHVALHNEPAEDLLRVWRHTLEPWGIGFSGGRAIALPGTPARIGELRDQFDLSWARKQKPK
ncbi:MAG: hypothetical protein HY791_15695 [Deltaproteobacteria bacterium]|nr:hypothetical protein [Deltaproteobacteria bacterium]